VGRKCKMVKFLRRDATRFSKFGNGRGKKAGWRKPKGRDNKMREKRRGYAPSVSIGYRTDKKVRGIINEKTPVNIMNINDLKKIGKNEIGIVGNIGKKNKIEIVKKAKELKIELKNINIEAFLKKLEKVNSKENKK
jgi:large subunit ribosomal protein L32e